MTTADSQPESCQASRAWWGALGGLVLLTLIAYLPALGNGTIWDDDNYVLHNLTLRSLDGLRRIWCEPQSIPQYYPLVHTTFWVEYHLWGLAPFGYHLVNILLHAGAAVLLWLGLRRIGVPGAWLAAALFALHPVQVESVAWITERKNVLSGVCYFGALYSYWRFAEHQREGRVWPRAGLGWYAAALGLYVLALLSKTVACSLPAALVLLLWWRRPDPQPRDWRRWLPLLPLFAVGLPLAFMTVHLEQTHVGARGSEWAFTYGDRCLIAGRALWFYMGKLAWPQPLIFIYPRWTISAANAWLYLLPLAFVGLLAGLWAGRRRWGRGPLVAMLIFAGTLVPALGFFNVYPMRYSFVADHFQYLASAAFLTLVAAAVAWLGARYRAVRIAIPCGLGLLMVLTAHRCYAFRNAESLWRDTLAKNGDAWIAHNNLGLILLNRQDYAQAIGQFEAALRLKSDHANAQINLGLAYEQLGQSDLAGEHYRLGLSLDPGNVGAINLVGNFFARQGQYAKARACYEHALTGKASDAPVHVNLGNVLAKLGERDRAIAEYQLALQQDPSLAEARENLARLQAGQGGR